MKRVTVFVGSARKKWTHAAGCQFFDNLRALGEVECDLVALSDYQLGICRGCLVCFEQGEEFCPLKDDRDVLIEKMLASDGVVFASPNYSFQVSALMKTFLDRLGFVFHRPRFFGKTFTSIVAQGFHGGDKILTYLDFVGNGLGFNTVKGSCLSTCEPMTEKARRRMDRSLAELSTRFHEALMKPAYPAPTLTKLMFFRWGRTSIRLMLDESSTDYRYYQEKGWLESDYFYPVRLGALKKAAGALVEWVIARRVKGR